MKIRNWRLRPELFDALWAGTGQDRIPYPFRIVSAHPGLNAYVAEQNRIREAFAGAEHDEVRSALGVLAEPEVYVEISGSTASSEQLVRQLQDWCQRAEASGIEALSQFSVKLRRYA